MTTADDFGNVISHGSNLSVLITGANGFVGSALCQECIEHGFRVNGSLRTSIEPDPFNKINFITVGEVNEQTDWSIAVRNVDVVIHLAARVHVLRERAGNPLDEFRKVNVAGTEHLALSAAAHGVKRFVYISSIGVNGNETPLDRPFSELDGPSPRNAYAVSKWEAEQRLLLIAEETGLEVVVVRPPLVYGKNAPGNFSQVLTALGKGMPLPFGSINNLRSLIYVGNLIDALILCATHPLAAGQTYLVSDGEDISTSDLLHELNAAMGFPALIFPFPPKLLRMAGRLTGKSKQVTQLVSSLRINMDKLQQDLDWEPPFSLREGLSLSIK